MAAQWNYVSRSNAVTVMPNIRLDPPVLQEFDAIAASLGCQILASEFVGSTLRVVLEHPDGVTIDHCQSVSRQISACLDVEDFGTGKYTLEVTSPGLDRKFYRTEDYERFLGERVRVTFQDPEGDAKKTVVARLDTFETAGEAVVGLLEESTEKQIKIPLTRIQVARLEPQI